MTRSLLTVLTLLLAIGQRGYAQTPVSTPANGVPYELPYDSVDCDNANGNPKLCTVEADEPDGPAVPAATPPPEAFPKSTMTMNVMPVTITGGVGAATGSETDALVAALHPLSIGETAIVSNKLSFVGARIDLTIKPLSTWLQDHSSVNGYKFQIGPTISLGGVKAGSKFYYGERAGLFVNYSLAWAVGMQFEVQWNNLPGYGHSVPSFSFGPNCHW